LNDLKKNKKKNYWHNQNQKVEKRKEKDGVLQLKKNIFLFNQKKFLKVNKEHLKIQNQNLKEL